MKKVEIEQKFGERVRHEAEKENRGRTRKAGSRDQKRRDQYLTYNYIQLHGLLGDQLAMRGKEKRRRETESERGRWVESNFKVALICIVLWKLNFE